MQVISCEHGRISLDEVFGPEAKGFIASLNTEGHHRGAVAAVKSQQLKEVSENSKCDTCKQMRSIIVKTIASDQTSTRLSGPSASSGSCCAQC